MTNKVHYVPRKKIYSAWVLPLKKDLFLFLFFSSLGSYLNEWLESCGICEFTVPTIIVQEIKFEPNVMCEPIDKKVTFRASQVNYKHHWCTLSYCIFCWFIDLFF